MSLLKITLRVEPDEGEQLVGLLAKAFGRGELGLAELRIERDGEVVSHVVHAPPKLRAVHKSTIAKMVTAGKRKRKGGELGERAEPGKPNGVTLALRAIKHQASLDGIRAMWAAHGLNRNGVGATLSKLRKRGYVRRDGEGVWRLTPTGEELETKLNAKVEQHDSQND
jgi:hypothetical protein